MVKRWTVGQSHFLVVRRAPRVRPRSFPERTLVMSKKITTTTPPTEEYNKEQGWNRNTDFCVDVKTLLRSDKCAKIGKSYQGVLRRDSEAQVEEFHYCDPHYTFVETLPLPVRKRSPRVFEGKYITVTHRSDGTFHPNFRPMKVDEGFSVDAYAIGVCNELRQALKGLVEEE